MKKLFCDCKTDEEKSNFFLSGRAIETGVIAPAISNDVAMAYHRCVELKKERDELRDENTLIRNAFADVIGAIEARVTDAQAQPAPSVPSVPVLTTAARDVLAERRRQIGAEGWTPEHDDEHKQFELTRAASCYALDAAGYSNYQKRLWPWDGKYWKPFAPRRNLVKAGALILAELERLDRAAAPESKS